MHNAPVCGVCGDFHQKYNDVVAMLPNFTYYVIELHVKRVFRYEFTHRSITILMYTSFSRIRKIYIFFIIVQLEGEKKTKQQCNAQSYAASFDSSRTVDGSRWNSNDIEVVFRFVGKKISKWWQKELRGFISSNITRKKRKKASYFYYPCHRYQKPPPPPQLHNGIGEFRHFFSELQIGSQIEERWFNW